LIGEHTDYNDGFVLPALIPQTTRVELARRDDDVVEAFSAQFADSDVRFRLGDEVKHDEPLPAGAPKWIRYLFGVTAGLKRDGHPVRGFSLRVDTDLPLGSGLSSSAALGVALFRAVRAAFNLKLDEAEIPERWQGVENDYLGAPVGVLDPTACALCEPGKALFLDCRSMKKETIAIPAAAEWCVIHSDFSHQIVGGGYAERVRECESAAKSLGVAKLRDATLDEIVKAEKRFGDAVRDGVKHEQPNPVVLARARHVVTENDRVLKAVAALKRSDSDSLVDFGRLMTESHRSQRDDYGVSIWPIDLLVGLSLSRPEVLGARLTGGGFGGSIIALCRTGSAAEVSNWISRTYSSRIGRQAKVLVKGALK
jgi:galactokinase